jgi:hypothetical protein
MDCSLIIKLFILKNLNYYIITYLKEFYLMVIYVNIKLHFRILILSLTNLSFLSVINFIYSLLHYFLCLYVIIIKVIQSSHHLIVIYYLYFK